jgi:hypothetical protein
MTIQQTIEIPADRRVYFDLPMTVNAGPAKITLVVAAETKHRPQALATMLMSEAVLAKDWGTPEEDAAWENL